MNLTTTRSTKPTYIYTLNIDGVQCYVGLTTREPSVRLFEHLEAATLKRTRKDRVLARALEVGCEVTITVIETVEPGAYVDQEERNRARLEDDGYTLLNSKQGDQLNKLTLREQAVVKREIAEWRSKTRKVRNAIKLKTKRVNERRNRQGEQRSVVEMLEFINRLQKTQTNTAHQ